MTRPALPRRALGRTGLDVSVLGFGTAPLGDLFARLDDATAIATVERAFALGVNLLDSSPLYGRGLAKQKNGDQAGGDADIVAAKAIKATIADEFAKYGVD